MRKRLLLICLSFAVASASLAPSATVLAARSNTKTTTTATQKKENNIKTEKQKNKDKTDKKDNETKTGDSKKSAGKESKKENKKDNKKSSRSSSSKSDPEDNLHGVKKLGKKTFDGEEMYTGAMQKPIYRKIAKKFLEKLRAAFGNDEEAQRKAKKKYRYQFPGWSEYNQEDALDVFENTEWDEVMQTASDAGVSIDVGTGIDSSTQANVGKNVSKWEDEIRKTIKSAQKNGYKAPEKDADYTEIVMAMMYAIAGGQDVKLANKKGVLTKTFFKKMSVLFGTDWTKHYKQGKATIRNATKFLYVRFIQAEKAYNKNHAKDKKGKTVKKKKVSLYKKNNALNVVLQSVVFGKNYAKTHKSLTGKDTTSDWYKANAKTFADKEASPATNFASTVNGVYSATSTGGGVIGNAIAWAKKIAADNSHGYSQSSRLGNPDYDCSSFVASVFKNAGIKSITVSKINTRTIRGKFTTYGFTWIPSSKINLQNSKSLQAGDILLAEGSHTELYIGGGKRVGAHRDYDGRAGDSTGKEISVVSYSNHPWNGILRYTGK